MRKLTSSSEVKIMEKINAELIFALNFAQILTSLLLVFSKKAILFLIYLLADKANSLVGEYPKSIFNFGTNVNIDQLKILQKR